MRTTRREILVSLLGAAGAAACRSRQRAPGFDGQLVDRVMADGHRLRSGFSPPTEGVRPVELPVLILGAGVAGLTASWRLREAGFERFALLELDDRPGGTASGGRSAVTAYPWGAHYVPAPPRENEALVRFLQGLGAVAGFDAQGRPIYEETHLCAAPKERVFFQGAWHQGLYPTAGATAADLEQYRRFRAEVDRLVDLRDEAGRRAFDLPVAKSSDAPQLRALDTLDMGAWMKARGFDSPLLAWYVAYACRDDFGTVPEDTSAWYALHYFAARTAEAGEESAEVLTWPSGNGFIVDHLAARLGPERLRAGRLVVRLEPEGDGRRVRVVAWNRGAQAAEIYSAERVIFALPSMLRSRLIDRFEGLEPWSPSYAPWLVANLHLTNRPEEWSFEPAWDNVLHGSRSLGYVVATHQGGAPRGPTVWTYYLPLAEGEPSKRRRELEALSWREASDLVVSDLERAHPDLRAYLERVDVMRWGHGMVRPVVGTAFEPQRARAQAPLGPIHFAHSDLSGVALFEEAFFHGCRAADEVLSSLRWGGAP